ncbi:MAG: TolC family protein [Parachlamydiaceae bacterium]
MYVIDFLHSSIYLAILHLVSFLSLNFSLICHPIAQKFSDKSAQQSPHFLRPLFLFFVVLSSILFSLQTELKAEEAEPLLIANKGENALLVSKIFHPMSLDDALISTLYRQVEIKIAQWNIYFQKGVIQAAAGPFDPVFNDLYTDTAINDEEDFSSNTRSNLKASVFNNAFSAKKTTRLGSIFTLRSDFERTNSLFQALTGATPNQRYNLGSLALQVEQALLRGGWNGINYQNEKAAIRQLDAVKYDFLQTLSQKVLATANAYWNFVAAIKRLKVNQEVLERFEKLKISTQKLIDANEAAAGDLFQILASLEIKKNLVVAAQYTLYLTMQQLLFAIGAMDVKLSCDEVDFDQVIDVYPLFPNIESDLSSLSRQTNDLISYAMKERFDVQSALIMEEVSSLTLVGLKNDRLPQLNFFGEMVTSDYKLGHRAKNLYSDLRFDHPQMNWSVGLSFSAPLYNDAAIGAYKQGLATLNQNILQTQLIKEQLIRDVLTTLKNQMDLSLRIADVNQSVQYYEKVVADQNEKLAAGFTTLFELITYETDLADARLLQINLYTDYHTNLADLRYFSGTLIFLEDQRRITFGDLTKVPIPNMEGTAKKSPLTFPVF